mmetsp:Transcript_24256/g.58136  ORF Transcript_24256/g.58136 Transcript_24256/m.58136 type:complete len:224 (+) Transcript_24256:843-1514(+)
MGGLRAAPFRGGGLRGGVPGEVRAGGGLGGGGHQGDGRVRVEVWRGVRAQSLQVRAQEAPHERPALDGPPGGVHGVVHGQGQRWGDGRGAAGDGEAGGGERVLLRFYRYAVGHRLSDCPRRAPPRGGGLRPAQRGGACAEGGGGVCDGAYVGCCSRQRDGGGVGGLLRAPPGVRARHVRAGERRGVVRGAPVQGVRDGGAPRGDGGVGALPVGIRSQELPRPG